MRSISDIVSALIKPSIHTFTKPGILAVLLFVSIESWGQSTHTPADEGRRTLRIVEWNVENVFDTLHDEGYNDYEFLPGGSHHWTPSRYWRKLDEIGKTLVDIGGMELSTKGASGEQADLGMRGRGVSEGQADLGMRGRGVSGGLAGGLPGLVGLCEVENDTVLTHLLTRSVLRTAGYRYIMTQSPDHRGVDVALLYHPALFRPLHHHSIRIPSEIHGLTSTRDLLYVSGLTHQSTSHTPSVPLSPGTSSPINEKEVHRFDTLHIIVCHLPSKTGGAKTAPKHRKLATTTIRHTVDSIMNVSPNARIIVMGDFNATPRESIFRTLTPPLRETLPTSRRELNRPIGTYFFQGLWSYLDHILVSPSIKTIGGAQEVRLPHLLDEKGHPYRTFQGPTYHGGISDHLPLVLDIEL